MANEFDRLGLHTLGAILDPLGILSQAVAPANTDGHKSWRRNQVEALTGPSFQLARGQGQPGPDDQTVTRAPMPLVQCWLPETRDPYIDLGRPQKVRPGAKLRMNRYSGTDTSWQVLVEWAIPQGLTGNLREIILQSDNDAKARYRVFIGDDDQQIPTDRQTKTPQTWLFPENEVPAGTSVRIDVLSVDGSSIIVDATLTGAAVPSNHNN